MSPRSQPARFVPCSARRCSRCPAVLLLSRKTRRHRSGLTAPQGAPPPRYPDPLAKERRRAFLQARRPTLPNGDCRGWLGGPAGLSTVPTPYCYPYL